MRNSYTGKIKIQKMEKSQLRILILTHTDFWYLQVLNSKNQNLISSLPISVNEARSLKRTSIVALSSRTRCAFLAMEQNMDIWDFKLNEEDMRKIAALDTGKSEINNHFDPEYVKRIHTVKAHE